MSEINQSTAQRVDVIATLSMESMIRSLNLPANLRFASEQVSLETQQLDEQNKIDAMAAHHENLRKLLKAEKPTGCPHLFVLDPAQLAQGDLGSAITLQALASAQFSDPRQAAVVMLPPPTGATPETEAATTLLKSTVLQDTGVVALESVDAIKQWLDYQNIDAPVTVALESIQDEKEVKQMLEERKTSCHPFSQADIDFIQEHMGQKLPRDLAKFYKEFGSLRAGGLTVYTAHSAMTATSELMTNFKHLPHQYFVVGKAKFKERPGEEFSLIVHLGNGKTTFFSENIPFLMAPKHPVLGTLKALISMEE